MSNSATHTWHARRIAILASGITSPLFSAVQFATHLRRDGHEVCFFAPESSGGNLAHAGFDHVVIPEPKLSTLTPLLPADPKTDVPTRTDAAVAALGVDDLAEALERFGPDLIIVDCEMHANIVVALSLKIPVVLSNNMFLSAPGLRAPPLHKKVTPGRGFWGSRLGVFLLWCGYLFRKQSKLLRRKLRDRGADHATALSALARRHDVPLNSIRRQKSWLIPWMYHLPTVLFLPKALDLRTQNAPDLRYAGAMVWQDRPRRPVDEEVLSAFCKDDAGTSRIYVAFGSMMTPDGTILERIWEAAARHPEWKLLCVVGDHWTEKPSNPPPANVHIVPWAPQHDILNHADLAIIHGGTSSLVEAVEAATPMLIYPHVLDQWGSAARVVYHGLGREGALGDSSEQIEADIQAILTDAEQPARSKAMQRACLAERAACRPSDLIEHWIAQNKA